MATSSIQSLRKAGIACIVGALITAIGGVVSQVAQASTTVSDEMWSYPWSSGTLVPLSLLWAFAHVLILVGLLGLRRSGLAGPTRAAAVGLALALTGTALLLVGEVASIPIRDQSLDDTGPAIVGGVFGIGTLLSAIGLILAGKATMQAGLWRDWRRFTPLVTGVWTLILVGLVSTKVMAAGIAVYGLCFLGLGVALYTRPSPVATAPASAQVQGA
ncbi:MAG: hypothetical protein M3417_12665 [Actinomycetota bacterium]|nr:hypothetical protein [Actinomycetota bacterium]